MAIAIICLVLLGCVRVAVIVVAVNVNDEAAIPTALSDAQDLLVRLGFRVEYEKAVANDKDFHGEYVYSESNRFSAFIRLRDQSLEIGFVDRTHSTGSFSPDGKDLSERGLVEVQRVYGAERVRIVRRTKSVEQPN